MITGNELIEAAQAVVDRWDSPKWKDEAPTGDFIYRLRDAIAAARKADATIATQAARIAALEQDAARYRWIRHGDNDERVLQRGPIDSSYVYLPRNSKLDEMIDAAIDKGGA